MRIAFRAARSLALAASVALATVTCTDQPTEPGGGHAARVLFAPSFAAGAFAAGLPLDNVTVTVVRPAAETLLVENAPFAIDDSVLQLDLTVDLLAPSESLDVTLSLRSGVQELFQGTERIQVTSGPTGTTPTIPLDYVGPGADIAWIAIAPRDSALSFGDTLTFSATAEDSTEGAVTDFYLRWTSGSPTVAIRSDGRVIAPAVRATIWIHAVTPTGIEDSTSITFTPVPTQLTKNAGDLQNGAAGDTLALPITVLVRAADDLPVKGVAVTFAATAGGGTVLDTVVATDSLGLASAQVVLGTGLGANTFSATVAGLAPVSFGATAGAGAPSAIAKQGGDAQSDTAGQALAPFIARVTDDNSNPVAGVAVVWTVVSGSGALSVDTVLTDVNGDAAATYTLGAPGADTVRAQIAGTGAFVDFTATAVAGAIQVVAVAGDSQAATVATALTDSLVVETQTLGTGIPVGGVTVIWTVQGGNGALSADTVVSDSLGRAAAVLTVGTVAGEVEVLVDAERGGPLGVFHLKALADAPHHLAYGVTPPDTLVAGVLVSPAPVIEVRDSFENVVPTAGIVIHAYTDGMIPAAPPVRISAPTGLQFTAFLGGLDSALTDSTGRATFDSLVVGGDVGDETLHFEEVDLGLGAIDTPIHLLPGAPDGLVKIAGDGQTAFVESLVTVAPRVIVSDSFGNVLEGVTVDWVVVSGGGQVTGASSVTDSLGEAEVGSWRMGASPGTNTLRAVIAGVDSAEFQATAIPLTPTISLTLLNTNIVGVGRTATLKVGLSRPDSLGVVVTLTNLNPSVVTLDSTSASFGPVDTTRFRVLTGVTAGTADIIASAPGYEPDTLTVTGSLNLITLPTTQNVAFGQTASLPVQLALPAPAGGVVVNVTSLDPSKVSVVTPTVTFNAGEQLKNATVSGVALGSAQVVAENPNYAPDTALVSTTAALDIPVASLSAFSTFGAAFTVQFKSAGSLTPAPAPGITVTLTPRDPACVAAPATVTVPTGQTAISDSLGYGGSATLPCVTYLVAEAPGIDADSVQVTITQPPAVTLSWVTTTVGSGMQDGSYSASLATGAHGGRNLTVRSLTPGVSLIQANASTAGTDSIVVFIPNTNTSTSFYLAGLEGITSDSALVVAEMPGFRPDTGMVYVKQGAFDLQGVPGSVNSLAGNSNIYVQMGVANAAYTSMNAYQGPRAGGTMPRLATVSVIPGFVATLRDSTATADTVKTTTFPVGQYYTPTSLPQGLQIDPLFAGTASVTASVPGLVALPNATRIMSVTTPSLSLPATAEVGAGLQDGNYTLSLSGGNHGGTTLTLRMAGQGIGVLQPNNATLGTDSLLFPIADGVTSVNFWVAGLEGIVNDSVLVVATAPGFTPDTMKLRVRQPAIDLQGVPTSTGSLSGNSNIYAQIGIANVAYTSMNAYLGPRFGGSIARLVTFTIAPGDFALLRDSTAIPDSMKSTTIPVGQYYSPTSGLAGIQIDPSTPGTAFVSASIPGFVMLPSATRTMNVTGPVLTLGGTIEVASGLQDGSYSVGLGVTAHGGTTVKLRTLAPGIAVIQPNSSTVGVDSLSVFVPDGSSSFSYYVAGLEGITSDSVQIEASAPGFTPDTVLVRVRRAAFDLQGVPGNTTSLSGNVAVYVQQGIPNIAGTSMNAYQNVRAGGTPQQYYIRSDAPTVVRMVDTATTGDSLPVTIPVGLYYSPTSFGTGGVGIDPLTTGSTTITATHPTFLALPTATRPITVSAPGISASNGTVGSGLQLSASFNLGADQHGGVDVVVRSTAPGVLKVSPNSTTPGSDSIIVHLNNGSTGGSYYVQGMEGQTGAPSVSISAPGFSDGTGNFTVVTPAIDLQGMPTSTAAGAANTAIYAQIGVANGAYTTMNDYQNIRAGGTPPTVTFTNGATGVVQLVTTALTADVVTAIIGNGLYYTPTSVASGGAALDPLTTGTATITVSAPGFIALPAAARTVTVTP